VPTAEALLDSFEIMIDGAALDSYNDVLSINVRSGLDTSAHARIEVDADDLDSMVYGVGKQLIVKAAPAGSSALVQVFDGTILGIACELSMGRAQFVIDAYDDSYKLGRETKIATHLSKTLSDVVSTIAGDASLTADVSGLPSTQFESLQQTGTPYQFLDRLVRAAGCMWRVEGTTLIVRKRNDEPTSIRLQAGTDLMSFRVRFSASEATSDVSVRGWDSDRQSTVVGAATAPTTAVTASIVDQRMGRVDPKQAVAWTRTPVDQNDAVAMATALRQRMDDSRITGRGQTPLVPSMVPGSTVEIDGMGAIFNGEYRVAEVEHTFQPGHAFVTRFAVGAPEPTSLVDLLGNGARPSSDHFLGGVTVGVVTNLEDPEARMRVKLKLPYLSDDEDTGWARVMQFGAGNKRGWWMHPEVDDEVIVAFENGDPRLPVVIGGVWSSGNTRPTLAALDGNRLTTRSYTSAKGHTLNFDDGDAPAIELAHAKTEAHVRLDDDKSILIEAPGGDLVIKNKNGSITIKADGKIALEGTEITLDAKQKVTIKGGTDVSAEGLNVKLTAKVGLEAKGTTAKLEGSGMAEVKGGMVKIN